MKKCLMLLFLFSIFWFDFSCTETTTPNDGGEPLVGECQSETTCWKKICPQERQVDHDDCVNKKLREETGFQLTSCQANQCVEHKTSDLAGGEIQLETKNATFKIPWLAVMVFPNKDQSGKTQTCETLKAAKDRMDLSLGRYFPPRTFDQLLVSNNIEQGDFLKMPFFSTAPNGSSVGVAPAGKNYIVVAMGYCNPTTGRPNKDTIPKWIACKEGIELVAGHNKNFPSIDLGVKSADSCP